MSHGGQRQISHMGDVSERKMNIHGDDNPIHTKQDDSQDKRERNYVSFVIFIVIFLYFI